MHTLTHSMHTLTHSMHTLTHTHTARTHSHVNFEGLVALGRPVYTVVLMSHDHHMYVTLSCREQWRVIHSILYRHRDNCAVMATGE